mgnify:CR=1 FL=1
MKRSQREAAARGSTHLLRLSLPAVRSNGSFEGADILAEAGAVPAILLCQVYRGVMAWALTPAAGHPGLFPPHAAAETRRLMGEAAVPEELRPALETVCELFDDPAGADASRVAEACMRIGEWAERRGDAPATALRFLQAGGTCSPNDARLAYRAGYVARRQAIWDIAELWFRHSSTVSRRQHDWNSHATAYLALGNSYYQQGRYAPAKREHMKALRVGKRHGLREVQGRAHHDLLAVASELGELAEAESNAQKALHAYGPTHPNVPPLAHDIAYFWITRGYFRRALPVFRALLPHFRQPQDRIRPLGSICRAAGGSGQREIFHEAWRDLWQLAPTVEWAPALPASLLQAAYGAVALQEWSLAQAGAEYALKTAAARGESDVIADAERTLDANHARDASNLASEAAPAEVPEIPAEALARELVASLMAAGSAA